MNRGSDDDNMKHEKVKLVFLGDQAVGKTSVLNRFMCGNFDPKLDVGQPETAHDRHGLRDEEHLQGRQDHQDHDVGHRGAGEVQEPHPLLPGRRLDRHRRLRHHQ